MRKLFSFIAAVLFAGSMMAAEVTITPANCGWSSDAEAQSGVVEGVTVAVGNGLASETELRIYKNQVLTISADVNITKIVFTCTANGAAKYGPGCFAAQDGYTFEAEGKTGTWEGEAKSLSFTAETNQVRATSIVVTLEGGDDPVLGAWAEIKFTEAVAADALAEDALFTSDVEGFQAQIADAGNKMSIDANDCRFGTAEDYDMYRFRLKSGGASGADKNFITVSVPTDGKLRTAVRTSSNSATDRELYLIQEGDTLYKGIIQESMAIEVTENEQTVKVYPFVEVPVKAGNVIVRYSGGLNFYEFGFNGTLTPEEKLTFDFKLENNILTITPSNNDPWAGMALPTAVITEDFGNIEALVEAVKDMQGTTTGKQSLDLTKLDPEEFPAGTECTFVAYGLVEGAVTTVASFEFVVPAPAQPITCAEVYTLEDKADVVLNDVVVTYVNGVNVWVKDASASMLLYLSAETTWKAGDVLKGVAGQVAIYNDLYEVKPSADQVAAVVVAEGEAPAPEELAEVTAANMNAYILMKGLALEGTFEEGKNGSITIYEGLALFNKFKQAYVFEAGKTYDVLGTVSIYKGALQVNFISAEALAPTLDKTVLYVAFPSENRPENIEVAGTFEAGKWGMRVFNGDWYTSNEDLYTSGEDTFKFRSSDNNDLILCKYNTGKAIWEQVILKFGDFPITEFKLEMVRLIEELDLSAAADYAWKEGAPEPSEELADPTNCAEAAEAALSVSENNELYNGGKIYTIEGYVTEIAYAWSSSSKNMSFWMADTKDGGKVLEAYKCAIEKEEDAARVGDKVKVTGALTKFNTTPEFAAGCTVEIVERGEQPDPQNLGEKTIAEFLELKNTVDTCILTGAIDSLVNASYGNFNLVDETGKVYIYGLKDAEGNYCYEAKGLAEGDIITVLAIYSEYYGKPQVKNAIFVSKKSQGIDNTSVEIKVEKFFRDGQLIIRKNGIEYNVQGAVIK